MTDARVPATALASVTGTVLVTGATGLIGRPTVAALAARGFSVLAASRSGRAVAGAQAVRMDCLDRASVRVAVARHRPTHLLHLAWADGPARWSSADNLAWVGASLDLLADFAAAGGARAVLVGSCAEYDWTRADRPLAEDAAIAPATLYGAAKAATGLAARAGAGALGLSLAWARPFFLYGPGEPEGRLAGDLVRGLREGREVPCTDGLQRRDFLYAGDVADALAALLASPVEGVVNIGSGRAVPVRYLIASIAAAMAREAQVRLGAKPRPANDPPLIEADVTRLTVEVGFRPAHDLKTGVRAMLAAEGVL
jgi:nucleoside-diphosphate-sugar epimerase